ncbi:MAG: Fe-S protein assembly co-chaperone HscB [Myxococcales bacterium]|nr:Fe-S protein assembly co-chaperone HscB [Myxococcales bacterium]
MDPFATLGLPRRYELDRGELEARYRELQKALHPDRHAGASASQRRMSLARAVEVNDAYRALKDDLRRAEALLSLYGGKAEPEGGAADPEFLMEVMELRESLGDAKAAGDLARVRQLADKVEAMRGAARTTLVERFGDGAADPEPVALAEASALVSRLKYFKRFLDEVSVIEEEALG